MAIKQLTVFVENKQGTVASVTGMLSKKDINLRALSIAETEGFGILRLIVNDEALAKKTLEDEGYLIKITEVVGVKIGDAPGKLSEALTVLDDAGINVEYLYAFIGKSEFGALVIIRADKPEDAIEVLKANKVSLVEAKEIYRV